MDELEAMVTEQTAQLNAAELERDNFRNEIGTLNEAIVDEEILLSARFSSKIGLANKTGYFDRCIFFVYLNYFLVPALPINRYDALFKSTWH